MSTGDGHFGEISTKHYFSNKKGKRNLQQIDGVIGGMVIGGAPTAKTIWKEDCRERKKFQHRKLCPS